MSNTENVLTNLCTKRASNSKTTYQNYGLKIIQFLKIYISQSMQIFFSVKKKKNQILAGLWMDTVTHRLKFTTKYSETSNGNSKSNT